MTPKSLTIKLHPADDVAVALGELLPGRNLPELGITCQDRIPAGHKVALKAVASGEPVRKYSQIIGFATQDILAGQHVHVHNLGMRDFARDYAVGAEVRPVDCVPESERATFMGLVRPDGRVATRNYLGLLTTVTCSATVAHQIAGRFRGETLAAFPNVDGVVAFGHGTGCGMAGKGPGFEALQRTLAGFARHPNLGGVLIVGLGCEVNQIDRLLKDMNLETGPLIRTMNIQQAGGTRKTIAWGEAALKEMLPLADRAQRRPVPASEIVLGLECGGSDALSGITANPALGAAADLLVRHGGTAVLSETTEIYGAEHLLTRRAESPEVGQKLIDLIHWWEDYTAKNGAEINNNPTPGNKAGGLTTILEKSLGAAAKGGSTNLVDVYAFAEPVTKKGFVFMDTPGFDLPSITGMVAGGANVVCFTTGCGTVVGSKPSPVIKLATNTAMYQRLEDDMDVNCGLIADGEASVAEMGEAIFKLVLEVASGRKSKSEAQGFGDHEFTPWIIGAVV